jgi:Cof subfamily protein (haloacid dehalogenase superfamily)
VGEHAQVVAFRALALDLDGTLLQPDGTLSDRDREAVYAATAAGWYVILATARWSQEAERIASDLGVEDPVIACSGAQVRRLRDSVDVFDRRLPAAFAQSLYDLCDEADGTAFVYEDRHVLLRTAADAEARRDRPDVRHVRSLAGAGPTPRCALLFGDELTALAFEQLQPRWDNEVRFLNSMSGHGAEVLTLTGHGADKGLALQVACDELGITVAEVVAMGDSETDVEMFRVAGASVAMGQSSSAVQQMATWVTTDNTDDGVGRAIEQLLSGRDDVAVSPAGADETGGSG